MGDTITIFLKSIILNYSRERLIYIGFTHVRILPGQAALFHSYGKIKHLKIAFGEEVCKQRNYLPYEPIDSIPMVTRKAVTAEDGVVTVQVFQLFYKGCVPPPCKECAMICKTTYITLSQGLNRWVGL